MKSMLTALAATMVAGTALADRLEAGQGIANTTARPDNNVTFVTRGGGNDYGYRGWNTVVGLTVLPWSLPNDESYVRGVRFDFGWGAYEETTGLDTGLFAVTKHDFTGFAPMVAGSWVGGDARGVLIGPVNVVEGAMYGLQIGFVNCAGDLHGVQIGLLNFNDTGIFFPILNAGF